MKRINRWHDAITRHLMRAAPAAQTRREILLGIEAAGLEHGSKFPLATLGARLLELERNGRVVRVRAATYMLTELAEGAR